MIEGNGGMLLNAYDFDSVFLFPKLIIFYNSMHHTENLFLPLFTELLEVSSFLVCSFSFSLLESMSVLV